jgi:hypothetical protein
MCAGFGRVYDVESKRAGNEQAAPANWETTVNRWWTPLHASASDTFDIQQDVASRCGNQARLFMIVPLFLRETLLNP